MTPETAPPRNRQHPATHLRQTGTPARTPRRTQTGRRLPETRPGILTLSTRLPTFTEMPLPARERRLSIAAKAVLLIPPPSPGICGVCRRTEPQRTDSAVGVPRRVLCPAPRRRLRNPGKLQLSTACRIRTDNPRRPGTTAQAAAMHRRRAVPKTANFTEKPPPARARTKAPPSPSCNTARRPATFGDNGQPHH